MDWFIPLVVILGSLLLGAMSPGPSFLQVARMSAARGRGAGIACALGVRLIWDALRAR
jgi:threonine/homoserine/homoserine lactone efflux protein